MQWHARASDFVDHLLTVLRKLVQIGRAKLRVGRSRENQVRHFQIADRPIVRRRLRIDLLRNPERSFANFVVRSDVANDGWINSIAINHHRVISSLNRIFSMRERARNHNVGIGCADEKAEFL